MAGIFRFLAIAVAVVCGIIGLIMGLMLISDMWGTFWTVVCLFIFPIPIYIAPWIAAIRDGDWTLVLISYGGSIAALIFNFLASILSKE